MAGGFKDEGDYAYSNPFVTYPASSTAVQIASSFGAVAVLDVDGSVQAFGRDDYRGGGFSNLVNGPLTNVKGFEHLLYKGFCGITYNNTVIVWGNSGCTPDAPH